MPIALAVKRLAAPKAFALHIQNPKVPARLFDLIAAPVHDGFEAPKAYWVPAISPGGMIIYDGDLFKGWKGDAIVTGLSGQSLSRVDIEGDNVVGKTDYKMGARIRAVDEGPDGSLYVLEDGGRGSAGRLLKLTPK